MFLLKVGVLALLFLDVGASPTHIKRHKRACRATPANAVALEVDGHPGHWAEITTSVFICELLLVAVGL
jgi:hypothetical protein